MIPATITRDQPFAGGAYGITPNEDLPDQREERQAPPDDKNMPTIRLERACGYLLKVGNRPCWVQHATVTERPDGTLEAFLAMTLRFPVLRGDESRELLSKVDGISAYLRSVQ